MRERERVRRKKKIKDKENEINLLCVLYGKDDKNIH